MTYTIAPAVKREIERSFPLEHVNYVQSALAERQLPMDRSAPPPRVHIAVIWLSKGDIKRFEHELEGACMDWRDTLVAAGLGNEDWKDVLAQRGIDCHDW
jgi:hypothetical protein